MKPTRIFAAVTACAVALGLALSPVAADEDPPSTTTTTEPAPTVVEPVEPTVEPLPCSGPPTFYAGVIEIPVVPGASYRYGDQDTPGGTGYYAPAGTYRFVVLADEGWTFDPPEPVEFDVVVADVERCPPGEPGPAGPAGPQGPQGLPGAPAPTPPPATPVVAPPPFTG